MIADTAEFVAADADRKTGGLVWRCRFPGIEDWWEDASGLTSDGLPTDLASSPGFRAFLLDPKQDKLASMLSAIVGGPLKTRIDRLCRPLTWQQRGLKDFKPSKKQLGVLHKLSAKPRSVRQWKGARYKWK